MLNKYAKSMILVVSSALMFGGCSTSFKSITDSVSAKMSTVKDYPKNENIEIPEVMGISDIRTVALEWRVQFTEDVDGYRIYRAKYTSQKPDFQLVRQINDRYVKHYVNTYLEPNTTYLYSMSTVQKGQESLPSTPIKVTTKKTPEPTSYIVAYSGMANSIKIMWKPSADHRVDAYQLEKYDEKYRKWSKLAMLKNRLTPEYIDGDLENGTVYKYRLRSVISSRNIVGEATKEVVAKTKPIPPVIENVNVISKPNEVVLTWDVADIKDVDHYNVYRIKDWQYIKNVALYKKLVAQTKETAYTDQLPNKNDDTYYYIVTVTDVNGLESQEQRPAVVGHTLRRPVSPSISEVKPLDKGKRVRIELTSNDERDHRYRVFKKIKKQFFMYDMEEEIFEGRVYVDKNINPEYDYEYYFVSIDRYGVSSKSTEVVEFSPSDFK